MSPSDFRGIAESVAFVRLNAGRPEAVVSVDLSNEGENDEHVNLSISAQNQLPLPKGGLKKETATELFRKMGIDPVFMYEVNGGFVVANLGATDGGEVSLFASGSELVVTASVDDQGMTREELDEYPVVDREAEFKKDLEGVAATMVEDYSDLLKCVAKLKH